MINLISAYAYLLILYRSIFNGSPNTILYIPYAFCHQLLIKINFMYKLILLLVLVPGFSYTSHAQQPTINSDGSRLYMYCYFISSSCLLMQNVA